MLREFLAAKHLTPSELLHSSKHQKTLLAAGDLLETAIRKTAAEQAAATNTSPVKRFEGTYRLWSTRFLRSPWQTIAKHQSQHWTDTPA